jgi:hypothetical protein
MLPGCGRGREPSGKYVSVIRLSGSGEEWTETIEFKRNGLCFYGHPPRIAECQWSRHGNTITISRNGAVLNELQYKGKELVDPQTAGGSARSVYSAEVKGDCGTPGPIALAVPLRMTSSRAKPLECASYRPSLGFGRRAAKRLHTSDGRTTAAAD